MKNTGKRYKHVIFDVDHTLINYLADEKSAFLRLYTETGVEITEELLALSRRFSEQAWIDAGLYDVHTEYIQREYHALYRSHVKEIFAGIEKCSPVRFPLSAEKMGERFLQCLENDGALMSGAEEILAYLSKNTGGRYLLSVATNGLYSIQSKRLAPIEKYFQHRFISEEMGEIKPLPSFFEHVLQVLGAKKDECLVVGDSLSSDIAGALASGIDSCWLNARGVENTTGFVPTYAIRALSELKGIL
ncbi:MAG: HAD-IA family hydrolase [Clostridia bacterium]|nr:HAD-IA family hydrolase [Clostridia bacterium]